MTSNKKVVPEAQAALDKFKMEVANEVGVNLKQGYNGDLTSKEAGSIGGQMVNNICPMRTMEYERKNRTMAGHIEKVVYSVCVMF